MAPKIFGLRAVMATWLELVVCALCYLFNHNISIELLRNGQDVNEQDENGYTPM